MFDPSNPAPYIVGMLVLVLAYFLKDAHTQIKIGLEQKATQKALEEAKEAWRADLRALNESHRRETERLEVQYEQKFAAVVAQFQGSMESVERNLTSKIDMVLHIIERRNIQ